LVPPKFNIVPGCPNVVPPNAVEEDKLMQTQLFSSTTGLEIQKYIGLPSMYFHLPSVKFGLQFGHWQAAISSHVLCTVVKRLSQYNGVPSHHCFQGLHITVSWQYDGYVTAVI
jgi:hypothetical protein